MKRMQRTVIGSLVLLCGVATTLGQSNAVDPAFAPRPSAFPAQYFTGYEPTPPAYGPGVYRSRFPSPENVFGGNPAAVDPRTGYPTSGAGDFRLANYEQPGAEGLPPGTVPPNGAPPTSLPPGTVPPGMPAVSVYPPPVDPSSWYGMMQEPRGAAGPPMSAPVDGPVRSRRGTAYFRAEGIVLRRGEPVQNTALVINDNNGRTVLTTGDLGFKNELGPRGTLGYAFTDRIALEFTYWQVQNWQATSGVTDGLTALTATPGSGFFSLPGDLGLNSFDYLGADIMLFNYSTDIRNYELNLLTTTIFEDWSVLGGFRYLNMYDAFALQSTDFDSGTSNFLVNTRNALTGGQIGLQYRREFDLFAVEVIGKSGIYNDLIQLHNFITDNNSTVLLRNTNVRKNDVAYVNEIALNGRIRLSSFLFLRMGYNLMWLSSVSTSDRQLDFTDTPASGTQIFNSTTLFLYGSNFGLEARY